MHTDIELNILYVLMPFINGNILS